MHTTETNPGAAPAELRDLEEHICRDLRRHTARAYRYLGNMHDAEDAVQDAMLSAFTHLAEFKSRAKLSTWVTSIVINAARAQRRRRKPTESYEELLETVKCPALLHHLSRDHRPTPEDICAAGELRALLGVMTDQLSPVCRKAVEVYLTQELNAKAASQYLGIPVPTFKAQLSRARKALRSRITNRARSAEPLEA